MMYRKVGDALRYIDETELRENGSELGVTEQGVFEKRRMTGHSTYRDI